MSEPLVMNAGSKKQVKAAQKRDLLGRDQEIEDLRIVLSTRQGRRLIWRVLEKCRVFGSVAHPSGSQVYYNAGQQDIGHFLMAEALEVDDGIIARMGAENKEEKKNG